MTEALVGFAALLLLSFMRVPIAFAMAVVGGLGMLWVASAPAAFANIGQTAFDAAVNYELSVMPLFVLMGNFITRARLSEELYAASYAFLGHRRGGLAMATVVACGGFGAVCGSSLATAATMSKVAMPSMRRYGYDDGLAAGSVAAGGTLGILIPPSVVLVLYGIMTQTSIGKLFAAGIAPGIVGICFYLLAVQSVIALWPRLGPPGERSSWTARLAALRGVWGVLLLFGIVMGGIYGGVFTPTEAAGIGAAGAFLFFLGRKQTLSELLHHLAVVSVAGVILIGALLILQLLTGGATGTSLAAAAFAAALALVSLGLLRRQVESDDKMLQRLSGASAMLAAQLAAILVLLAVFAGISRGTTGAFQFIGSNGLFAASSLLFCALVGKLTYSARAWGEVYETLLESAVTVASLFTVLIGALLFANFVNYTTFPDALLDITRAFEDSPWLVLVSILAIYIVLGCVFESLSMILLTVPIFFPVMIELAPGFGLTADEAAIWFGIVVVVVTEISLITPPVGLNVFVLRGLLPDVSTTTIFRGVTAFWIADVFRLAVIAALPIVSLWLTQFVK